MKFEENVMISAADFQNIYKKCFNEFYSYSDQYNQVRDELPNLLLINPEKRDEAIVEGIKRIRTILTEQANGTINEHPALARLKLLSTSIPTGVTFWNMFSAKVPFDAMEKVKNLFVSRIKTLQDELEKHGITDRNSLEEFLSGFSTSKKTIAHPSTNSEGGYFKPGADSKMHIGFAQQLNISTIPANMYSEKELEQAQPEIANQIRNIRDSFAAKAKQGQLITEKIVIQKNPLSGQYLITLTYYDSKIDGPIYPYTVTLNALIFDQIKQGSIRTKEEAYRYALKQIMENPLFKIGSDEEISSEMLIIQCAQSINQFNDAFASLQALESSQKGAQEKTKK
jgi:hypothetical protein